HALVAAVSGQCRQSDAGVAGGALHDGEPLPQSARSFGLLDDAERGAVFDAATGIHEFGLAVDIATGGVRERFDTNERRAADDLRDVSRGHDASVLKPISAASMILVSARMFLLSSSMRSARASGEVMARRPRESGSQRPRAPS